MSFCIAEHRAIGSVAVLCAVSGRLSFLCHFDLLKRVILLLSACADNLFRLRAETDAALRGGCMSFTGMQTAFWRHETEPFLDLAQRADLRGGSCWGL